MLLCVPGRLPEPSFWSLSAAGTAEKERTGIYDEDRREKVDGEEEELQRQLIRVLASTSDRKCCIDMERRV